MAAVESRELVGAAHSHRISQMRRGHESQREREQKAEQHLEDARIIQIRRRQVRVALDEGRRFTESCRASLGKKPKDSIVISMGATTGRMQAPVSFSVR